jgi:hypothetical protein
MLETLYSFFIVVSGILLLGLFVRLVDKRDDEDPGYRDDEEL